MCINEKRFFRRRGQKERNEAHIVNIHVRKEPLPTVYREMKGESTLQQKASIVGKPHSPTTCTKSTTKKRKPPQREKKMKRRLKHTLSTILPLACHPIHPLPIHDDTIRRASSDERAVRCGTWTCELSRGVDRQFHYQEGKTSRPYLRDSFGLQDVDLVPETEAAVAVVSPYINYAVDSWITG